MSHYREPPIDTVLRHLSRASEVAEKRRVVVKVRDQIGYVIALVFAEIGRQRKAGRRK